MSTIAIALMLVAIWAAFFVGSTFVFMWLWNFVIPPVLHIQPLNFWYAAAIVLLLGFIGKYIKSA